MKQGVTWSKEVNDETGSGVLTFVLQNGIHKMTLGGDYFVVKHI